MLASAVAMVAGCGGGGGGGGNTNPPAPPGGNFTLTGTVQDFTTHTAISGARVTIGTDTATTNNSGQFTVSMISAPTATTFSVDLSNARPIAYTYWVNTSGHAYNSTSIPLPSGLGNGSNVGTVYAVLVTNPQTLQDNAPPPPIFN